jgi:lycopene beta-cyclase
VNGFFEALTAAVLGPPQLVPILIAWVGFMIAVPLLARRGRRGRVRGITLGVFAQATLVVVYLLHTWDLESSVRAFVLVPFLGWFAELVGSRTGIPFGRYEYTAALQPQVKRVPVVIPLAWLMMMPPSWAVAEMVVPDAPWWLFATVAAAAFTAWDIFLDPHLVSWRFWEWEVPGRYYAGIPLSNFLGWFLWAWIITAVVQPPSLLGTPLLLVYVLTWLFQFGGHLVFWKLPLSAVAGFIAMGSLAVPAVRSLLAIIG